ncbi:MAG TPA: DUF983 domain-containing protein [Ktedonobacterales bacterium]|jgi:uncharacterized protein (DUF983 family)|nr:DUF983 domain-containing protein [Ktedonobacterales bacterium]
MNLSTTLWLLLVRAVRLRCPVCGRGRLFRPGSWFRMYEECSWCGHHFEREEGYFVGAMAINLIVTEGVIFVAVIALVVARVPLFPAIVVGIVLGVGGPLLFFRHARSFWMAIDLIIHPLGD